MSANQASKGRPKSHGSQGRSVFAYSVAPERIRAFATSDFSDIDYLTVFSPKPLPGLRSRKVTHTRLPSGKEALTVEEGGVADVGLVEDSTAPQADLGPDARARAILRGVEYAQADLRDAGGAFDLEQVRKVMRGISRQAIDKQVKEGRLLAVPGQGNRRRYPTLQFNNDGSVIEGLKAVHDALPTRNSWALLNFLTNPQDLLGGAKPIDQLRAGRVDEVVEAARGLGEQGA